MQKAGNPPQAKIKARVGWAWKTVTWVINKVNHALLQSGLLAEQRLWQVV
jgi:hypothetical protein